MKDREAIFVEYMTLMRKREKEDSKSRGEKVSVTHSHIVTQYLKQRALAVDWFILFIFTGC